MTITTVSNGEVYLWARVRVMRYHSLQSALKMIDAEVMTGDEGFMQRSETARMET